MLVPMLELLQDARARGYAVPAANVFNDISVKACFDAARSARSPVIIACTPYVALEEISLLTRLYQERYPEVPVALHLEHGSTYESMLRAIRCGFTSVMMDKSTLPFEENAAAVREVVKVAKPLNVTVEAELGHVGKGAEYAQTRDGGLTRPEEAARYVEETGVDCLAVAVGTSHGVYKGTPKLDFELLRTLRGLLEIPLVLHGGSNTGDEKLAQTVRDGIQKINLSTDLSTAFLQGAHDFAQKEYGGFFDPETGALSYGGNRTAACNNTLQAGGAAYQAALEHYMDVFYSAGKI